MDSSITSILFSLIALISPLVIFIASSYYFSKIVKADSVLLFVGSAIGLLISVFYNVLMPYLIQTENMSVNVATKYYTLTGIIGFIGGISFAIGLFMLIIKTINGNSFKPNRFPNEDFLAQNKFD